MRTFVVGDIHGGLRGLEEVLDKVKPQQEDTFIFVGDYVDGWSDCAQTIDFLLFFSERVTCHFIRGNHDVLLQEYLTGAKKNEMWIRHGGVSSVKSYAKLSEAAIQKHISFLEALKDFYIDTENNLFLHAGFTNPLGPQHEYFPELVYWDRTLWEMVCALDSSIPKDDDKYPKRLKLFTEIFIGHTPVTRVGFDVPANFGNVWNVDTGAAFKGAISVMDIKTKQVWQSTPVYQLYPEEKGRN